jgi:N-methylhydantoinase A
MNHTIADHADVISAIGVALALIRETVERQVVNPSKEEILRIRNDATTAVQRMGADPKTVEVHLEIDNRTNTLRATAYGASKIVAGGNHKQEISESERIDLAASSIRVAKEKVQLSASTDFFKVYTAQRSSRRWLGLFQSSHNAFRVIDAGGSIRLQSQNGIVDETDAKNAETRIAQTIEAHSQWGDAGKIIPNIIVLSGGKIIDLSGLLDTDQVIAVARTELENLPAEEKVIILAQIV